MMTGLPGADLSGRIKTCQRVNRINVQPARQLYLMLCNPV